MGSKETRIVGIAAAVAAASGLTADYVTHSIDRGILPRFIAEHCGNFTAPFLISFIGGLLGTVAEIKGQEYSLESIEKFGKIIRWTSVFGTLTANIWVELQFLDKPELLGENAADCAVGLVAIGLGVLLTRHFGEILKNRRKPLNLLSN